MEINKDLTEYIRLSREAGVQEYFIRQALLEVGWDRDLTEAALESEDAWPRGARVDILNPKN
ncbi:MAG: hypothetical protein Q8P99_00995 [bacterium]|nr:hypothetical protein [bacterium]